MHTTIKTTGRKVESLNYTNTLKRDAVSNTCRVYHELTHILFLGSCLDKGKKKQFLGSDNKIPRS